MQTKELGDLLGLSTATLRGWTINTYRPYMSPGAQGGRGRVRQFSEQDARIIALVASLRSDGLPHNEIVATLDAMRGNEWADLPPLPAAPPGYGGPVSMIPEHSAQTAVIEQRKALVREIALLSDRVDSLEVQLADERAAHTETRTTLTAELVDARERLGELRGQLQENRPMAFWLRVVVLVAVGALILGGGLVGLAMLAGG